MSLSRLCAAWSLIALQACAHPPQAQEAAPLFAKSEWTVSAVSCPVGCSKFTRDFLQAQLGRRVLLDNNRLDAPFLDRCPGGVRYLPRRQPVGKVLAELGRAAAPGTAPMTPAHLGVAGDAVVMTANVLCREGGAEMSYQRLLSVEAARVQLLFEEQSIIELR